MQTISIYAGDSGELVTAAYTWSVAHPPGYPLYTLLGGIISHGIPFVTVAWRVGLLSSIPMAWSIYFLWKIVFFFTKSKVASSAVSLLFGFLYPVWLYAIVPEVFGLFSLFSALIFYLFLLFLETKKTRYAFLLAFLSGLSFTHHHLIILLVFSMGMSLFYSYRKLLRSQIHHSWKLLLFFFMGLSVYIYLPIISSRYPLIDWEHPASPMGFLRLITRASYGTFKATYGSGESLIDRGLNLFTLMQYILKDFTVIGILFFCIGIGILWKRKKPYALFFLMYLMWQFFYFFYAGFTLTSDFAIGTLERFFIVPYQLFSIGIGIGVWGLADMLRSFWQSHRSGVHIPYSIIQILLVLLVFLIPIRSFKYNYAPLKALHNDTTLEKLADDVLKSAPVGSIVNLGDDTSLFAVFYALYVQNKRPDIRLVLFPQFQYSYYPLWLKHHYTDIAIPSTPQALSYPEYLKVFLQANYPQRPILSERTDTSVPQFWVPRGLLAMYYPTLEDIPPREQTLVKNNSLWESFQDPLSGVIGVYKHMMLSDVLRYYSSKRMTLALSFLLFGNVGEAQHHVREAIRLTPKSLEIFLPFITTLLDQRKCQEAFDILNSVPNVFVNQEVYLETYHQLYGFCPDFQMRVEQYEKEYQEFREKRGEKIEL